MISHATKQRQEFLSYDARDSLLFPSPASFRCAFHAYADSTYAKHLENGTAPPGGGAGGQSLYGTIGAPTPVPMSTPTPRSGYGPPMMMAAAGHHGGGHGPMLSPGDPSREYQQSVMEVSEDSINSIEKVEEWSSLANGNASGRSPHRSPQRMIPNGGTPSPRENGKKRRKTLERKEGD